MGKRSKKSPSRGVRRKGRRQQRRIRFREAMLPAFFLFMQQHRAELQRAHPRWTAVATVKELGKMWHRQPEQDKTKYKEQAAWLRSKAEEQPATRRGGN